MLALMAFDPGREAIQELDDAAYRGAIRARSAPLTALGEFLSVAGSGWVLTPVRLVVAAVLMARRRWLALAAFVAVASGSQAAVWSLKAAYARPRPSGGLVDATGYAFPSGHAVLVTAVAFALVLVATAPGRRHGWWTAAAILAAVMAASRVYLLVHWLSDTVAGVLVGGALAVGVAAVAELSRRSATGPAPAIVNPPAAPPAPRAR
jgi:membrane-associated phospholipid phosphatase